MSGKRPVVIAAGGTGGHLFPAAALAHALESRGFEIHLVTDERAAGYSGNFPARAIHYVAAASPRGGPLVSRLAAIIKLAKGTFAARRLLKRIKPCAVAGFGGYPAVPPVMAAAQLGIPAVLHEANAVIGRANRFLAPRADAIATGFAQLGGLPRRFKTKAHFTGNPVRPVVIEAAKLPYPPYGDGILRILVTGGSQGARIFSDIVPAAIGLLPDNARKNLMIVQQARSEDEERVRTAYQRLDAKAEIRSFFPDLPFKIANSHLIIARAGASTVAELAVIGRPAILVPLPHALDQDQAANASAFGASGVAAVVEQSVFSPQWLATSLMEAQAGMASLERRAEAAKATAVPDAAERLASLVENVVSGKDSR